MSQVATYAPNGTDKRWLGELGHVSGVTYSYVLPGGPDQFSCLLAQPPSFRHPAMNPGRIVRVHRGASYVWQGKLQEPQPSTAGWQISATGNGQLGANFRSVYSTWNGDDAVNQAITRGLPWVNRGFGSVSGLWLGQPQDSGSQTITDMMNLLCSNGGLTWYVGRRNILSVYPFPSTAVPTRLLVATTPVARTITEDVNAIFTRYQASDDATASSGAVATFGLTESSITAGVAAHGEMEDYMDLSGAGTIASTEAQAAANAVLAHYQRAAWDGPFTVSYGQYLTPGGFPVDLGCEQAGEIVKLLVTDGSYGGEVSPVPICFLAGATEYDNDAELMTVTPFQSATTDLAGMMSSITAALTPASTS